MSAATKAKTANARGRIAVNMIKNQTTFGRAFDDCFEMLDGDAVMEYITKKAATDYKLALSLKHKGILRLDNKLGAAVEYCIANQ